MTRFPRRVLDSIEARQSTGFLKDQWSRMGYAIEYLHFNAVIEGRRKTGRNVLAFRAGRLPDIIAVVAHYDTAKTTFQGAMDNGSGISVLLELARVFSQVPIEHSFLFVATDGGEWGMLGARDLAFDWPERRRIAAVVSLDFVANGDIRQLRLETVGQRSGYTPPWLRDLARRAAESSGLPVAESVGLQEHVERALMISFSDQGPFLDAGIPAINLGSFSTDVQRQAEIYHSQNDVIANLKPSSIASYGRAAEILIRWIDAIQGFASESMSRFAVRKGFYLSPFWIALLQYGCFIPFLVILYFEVLNHGNFMTPDRVARELLEYAIVLIVLGSPVATIPVLGRLRWIPRYSLYPATPKDPVLESPDPRAFAALLIVLVLAGVLLFFARRPILQKLPEPDFRVSKLVLMSLFFVVIAISLQSNSYWAVTFLWLPAWAWGMIGRGNGLVGRAANRVCVVSAGIVYYSLLFLYAQRLGLGWKIAWYQVIAIANGMFRPQGVVMALAVFSLGIRFLAIQSQNRSS